MTPESGCYIGTSGWSYPTGEGTWKGFFYPAGTKNELEFYSQFFNTVEVNSSFYRPPAAGYVHNWAHRVPDNFRFSVKLWQKFTHPKMFKESTGEDATIAAADVDTFRQSLDPLAAAGKLGVLLAQFPPSFKNDERSRRTIDAIANAFREYPLAVELRHRSWSDDDSTTGFLRERNIAWADIDEPKFDTSISADIPVTADLAYFRFHGRNAREWWTGNAETRYRYLYNAEEIAELAARIRSRQDKVKVMYAFFNNHWQAYAPRNATGLKKALQLPFQDLQMHLDVPSGERTDAAKRGDT